MAESQPKQEEAERLQKLGIPVEDEEAPAPKLEKVEEKTPVVEEPVVVPKVETEVEPVVEKKPEETPVAVRPEKYIPIPQYLSEKKAWGEKETEFKKRISELEAVKASEKNSEEREKLIKDYAVKYGVEEDSVRELAKIFGGAEKKEDKPLAPVVTEEKAPELSDEQKKLVADAEEIKASKAYDEEFRTLAVPDLTKRFPDAKPEQLEKAKKALEVLATTREYLDKPLDFIIFKEAEELGKIFAEVKPRGVESARRSPERKTDLDADDFKNVTDFSELKDLPSADLDKLVKQFDNKTWTAYKNWVRTNDELTVSK